jgi:hypothetical protein
MGLFKRVKDPVEGTAQVVSCSGGSQENAAFFRCWMSLVLTAPGLEPHPVETTKLVRSTKRPSPGMVLPVTIDRARPDRFEIDWDRVPTRKEVARHQTEQAANAMQGGGTAAEQIEQVLPGATIHVEGEVGALPPEALDAIRSALDPEGSQTQPTAPPSSDDRIGQLQRLADLHEKGALTDEEFAAEKRRLLDS